MARKQLLLFIAALCFLVFSLLFARHLISSKKTFPKKIAAPHIKPTLSVIAIQRQDHPIIVHCYGTALPEKTVLLKAPISGKILKAKEIYPGKNVYPQDILFEIEKTKIDFAIQQHQLEIHDLKLQKKELEMRNKILKKQAHNANEHYTLNLEALNNQNAHYTIEEELFRKSQSLFEKNHISSSDYLRQKSQLHTAESLLISTQQKVESSEDTISQLELSLKANLIARKQIPNQIKILELGIASLEDDRQKSDISPEFPAEIIATQVYNGQEVSIGTELATIRSIDGIELKVNIPDHYFRWLYAGNLLDSPENHSINIRLVNSHFHKRFPGAWIKSVAESVNVPTRSLPLIIGRKNPKNKQGKIIPKEELKPGMYCEVLIELCKTKNSFYIPYSAIQNKQRLYYVTMKGEDEEMTLSVIEHFEILHEEEEGVIVRLDDHYKHLLLVAEPFKKGKAGTQITIKKLE